MKSRLTVCCILLCASCCALAAPFGRVGEALVRAAPNGLPCFTISAREERRGGTPNFDAVSVTDQARGALLWKMAMPPERTFPVRPSMCVPYGGRVQALPQTPAAPLENGRVYRVRIEARPTPGLATPAAYDARFCLVARGDGDAVVRPIGRDERLSGCAAP
jgi:hypothetical protein